MPRSTAQLNTTTLAAASAGFVQGRPAHWSPSVASSIMDFQLQVEDAQRRGYVVAFRLLGDRDAATDACQEALSKAMAALPGFDRERPFYPWFYRILRNHCLDVLSRRRRERPSEIESDGPGALVSGSPSVEQTLMASERQKAVLRAIEKLEPDLREIIELRHFQDLSYDDMAAVLGCPVGTVMSRLYRARKRLRALLLEDADFAGDKGAS